MSPTTFALVTLFACSLAPPTTGQIISFGQCPTQAVVSNFDISQYLGKWYEYSNYFTVFQLFGKCVTAEYTDLGNNLIKVTNLQRNFVNMPKGIEGFGKLADPSGTDGRLTVSFAKTNPWAGDPTQVSDPNYLVLDTDYTSYSIVWSCNDSLGFNTQLLWLLTRDRVPSDALIAQLMATLEARGLNTFKLKKTDQSCTNA